MSETRIDLDIVRGAAHVQFELDARPSDVIALIGPNGAGKSTILRSLAGLLRPQAGSFVLAGRTLYDDSTWVPPEQRGIGVVFQDGLLFPHLSALENVAFGLRARGRPKAAAATTAQQFLDRVGVGDLATRRPAQLSGGQAQRVALARALAIEPAMLLLDEPLSALDAGTRMSVRADLRRYLADFDGVAIVVTHDPIDATALADRLVVLEEGKVVQSGTGWEVASAPRTQYVADLVGVILLHGTAEGTRVQIDGGGTVQTATEQTGQVIVAIRPSSVALYRSAPDGSPRNVWQARIDHIDQHGTTARVSLVCEGGPRLVSEVTVQAVVQMKLRTDDTVFAVVKANETGVYRA